MNTQNTQNTQNTENTENNTTQGTEIQVTAQKLNKLCDDLNTLNYQVRTLLANFIGIETAGKDAQEAVKNALESLNAEIIKIKEKAQETFTQQSTEVKTEINNYFEILKESTEGLDGFDYKAGENPSVSINPTKTYAVWLNYKTLELFVCLDNTTNKNIWIGSRGTLQGEMPVIPETPEGQEKDEETLKKEEIQNIINGIQQGTNGGGNGSWGGNGNGGNGNYPNPDQVLAGIGEGGKAGFGVGIAPRQYVVDNNLYEMQGTNDPTHANFGNYTDRSGSVMVWIPKMYVRKSFASGAPYFGTKIEVSLTPKAGFALPRCFINAGQEIDGLFLDKYKCSAENGVLVSKRGAVPCNYYQGNCMSLLGTEYKNTLETAYKAIKTRGEKYALPHVSLYTFLADLADAHYQRLYEKTKGFENGDFSLCLWADKPPYQIKGNNVITTLRDESDEDVQYESGYTYSSGSRVYKYGKNGSVPEAVFGKITHNGQKCGVADLSGNYWETASGYITDPSKKHFFLKESVDLRSLNDADIAYDTSLYDEVGLPIPFNGALLKAGNGENPFFSGETDRTNVHYINDQIGFPINTGALSTQGEARFGQDGFWLYSTASMVILVGGNAIYSSSAGARARNCRYTRTNSNNNTSLRSCLIP